MFTARTLTNALIKFICAVIMPSVKTREAITLVVAQEDLTETASTVLISMSAVLEA